MILTGYYISSNSSVIILSNDNDIDIDIKFTYISVF